MNIFFIIYRVEISINSRKRSENEMHCYPFTRKFVRNNFFLTLKTVRRRSGAIIQIDRADPMCIERYYLFELYCFEWGSAFIIARCVQKIDNILKAFFVLTTLK